MSPAALWVITPPLRLKVASGYPTRSGTFHARTNSRIRSSFWASRRT